MSEISTTFWTNRSWRRKDWLHSSCTVNFLFCFCTCRLRSVAFTYISRNATQFLGAEACFSISEFTYADGQQFQYWESSRRSHRRRCRCCANQWRNYTGTCGAYDGVLMTLRFVTNTRKQHRQTDERRDRRVHRQTDRQRDTHRYRPSSTMSRHWPVTSLLAMNVFFIICRLSSKFDQQSEARLSGFLELWLRMI